jgi:hypothetical protein
MEILKMAVRGQNRAAGLAAKSVRVYPTLSGAATECAAKLAPKKGRLARKNDGKTTRPFAGRTCKPIVNSRHMPILGP